MIKTVIQETKDYILILLSEDLREHYSSNYAIVNKEHGVIEAVIGCLSIGIENLNVMQKELDEVIKRYRPKPYSVN